MVSWFLHWGSGPRLPRNSPRPDDGYAAARAIVADIGRIATPNGVQATFEATLGGARQVVNARGADRANSILLFIHGGPGAFDPGKLGTERKWNIHFGGLAAGRHDADFYFHAPGLSPEYSVGDRRAWDEGSAFWAGRIYDTFADRGGVAPTPPRPA